MRRRSALLLVPLLALTLLAAACGEDEGPEFSGAPPAEPEAQPPPDPPPDDVGSPAPGPSGGPRSARVGVWMVPKEDWPLTVQEAVVRCDDSTGRPAVDLQTPEGSRYGVNAAAVARGFPRLDPIWRRDDDAPSGRVDLAPVLGPGLALCG